MQLYLSLLLSSSNAIYWNNLLLHCVAGGCVWKSSTYLQIHMTLYIKTYKELSIYLRLENADSLAGSATRCQALQNWSFPGLKESSGLFFFGFPGPTGGRAGCGWLQAAADGCGARRAPGCSSQREQLPVGRRDGDPHVARWGPQPALLQQTPARRGSCPA